MKPARNIFTPNTERGGGERYVLYKRANRLLSITPNGRTFKATWEADDCGLGCKCAAFITAISKPGAALLARAERIDNHNGTTKELS